VIVIPDAPEVIGYVERTLKVKIAPPAQAFGYVTDDGKPLAAVVVNDYTLANCELTIVAERGGLTRPVLRHIAEHAFKKLGCRRVTVRTRKRNKHVQHLALRAGFKFETVAQHYFEDDDAVVYRMKREDCPWIGHKNG
jgi:RimJ/RimL family protein N-acetyltransferase